MSFASLTARIRAAFAPSRFVLTNNFVTKVRLVQVLDSVTLTCIKCGTEKKVPIGDETEEVSYSPQPCADCMAN